MKIEKVYSKSVKAYGVNLASALKHDFDNTVLKIREITKQAKFIVLERHKTYLKVVKSDTFSTVSSIKLPNTNQNSHSIILDFEVSESNQTIGALCYDRRFYFWSFRNTVKPILVGETDVLMDSLWRLEALDLWVTCSSTNSSIKLWKQENGVLKDEGSFMTHSQEVTSIFYVSQL